ncbi:pilus assembly protein [Mesorhizobium sp. CA18]|uniref:TadE/TadG family type IV pilus assembly protein n=1 Tax=unclassified Mesorhizobium TaxID=325217 RepID=UPI001CCED593|nr:MULTISPECIES: TadE/TadG family type IV pilus assembly protein [unclassified Mesorhizobium]MBZ9734394.1 pilus assembly protein [Mesorhizobium sp. CA9]MBZ9824675.1 pilus assembly protein [Mesorhizobium sp. CA18]MBZ9829367.1 pilus assembly protein [Mesorhizobium sp. CA2]MBZ9837085.1 pilus assembly protein [Mesorhizobium sp. CA3]MBZ9878043.1 pilus assembly protein [Mesorhizobium sp. Ca11]
MLVALRHIIRHFKSDDDGAALVEMAIVTPFVLLLSAGVFEFGNILNTRMLLDAGVKDAARYMARCSSDWDTCKALAQTLAANGAINGTSARVSGWLPSQVIITPVLSTPAIDTATGTELYLSSTANVIVVQVSTSYPYPDLGFWSYLGFGQISLSVSHQERVLGW